MSYVENSVLIKCKFSEVYDFILNGDNNILWNKMVNRIERIPDEPVKAGTIFVQELKVLDGKIINADFKILECEKNSRIVFQVLKGPYLPIGVYTFEDIDNMTKVKLEMRDGEDQGIDKKKDEHLKRVVSSIVKIKEYLERKR